MSCAESDASRITKRILIPSRVIFASLLVSFALLQNPAHGQSVVTEPSKTRTSNESVRQQIEQLAADLDSIQHRYRIPLDTESKAVRREILETHQSQLSQVDFSAIDRTSQIDYLLLRSELEYLLQKQSLDDHRDDRAAQYLPYAPTLVQLCRDREVAKSVDAESTAATLDAVSDELERLTESLISDQSRSELHNSENDDSISQQQLDALRATELLSELTRCVQEFDAFYRGYDPLYSWWTRRPMERLLAAMEAHRNALRNHVVGVPESDSETIIGLPIGSEELALELRHAWIAHPPEELIEMAQREMKWCEEELAKASRELGFENDWRKAMEFVKDKHVPPGEQPKMIYDLAWEAIEFLRKRDLVTIPDLCANGWRITMMSPERQRVSPYFLGGDTIIVSYPTDSMTHEEKMMSMRSNNEHFSRATVHHELIPGHQLQYYMLPRNRPYRALFATPFWLEGWALYWEMLLWDLDFARNAEDRVGMLFWRKHRCARVIFSLGYHSGTMTAEQCIDYLVEKVGHEPSAAAAEVRRSVMGGYGPLYQAAYMVGGLQFRQLHQELVQSGRMSDKAFHDDVLRQHSIPIEALRLHFLDEALSPDWQPNWRFAD